MFSINKFLESSPVSLSSFPSSHIVSSDTALKRLSFIYKKKSFLTDGFFVLKFELCARKKPEANLKGAGEL